MTNLPEKYLSRMKIVLGDEYDSFLACYNQPVKRGIRFNQRKARPETITELTDAWNLIPVAWCPTGYVYADVRPGLSVYHDAGVFYIQEPSAMSVVEEAKIRPTDLVLDLCAAPGGKSTAAAERCKMLVANEISPQRAKILSSNIERMGFDNTIVCSAEPQKLSECMSGLFDVVLVDAPCSGEGMMRRDEIAISEWSEENVALCVERQRVILNDAAKMVRTGGKLVYSTCTFEPGENEEQISEFLADRNDFELLSMKRIWPHKQTGEGHFCAVMIKKENSKCASSEVCCKRALIEENLNKTIDYYLKILSSNHIHILRAGLVKGEYFKDKRGNKIYEPSHSEILSLSWEQCESGVNLHSEKLALDYLQGNVLRPSCDEAEFKGDEGYCGVFFDGYAIGLGKRSGNVIKNHLPKGLRRI